MHETLLKVLNKRYATKHFDTEKKLSKKDLDTIIESVRLTPTAFGLQLMKLVIVENKAIREKLLAHSFNQKQVVEASHLLILCRETEFNNNQINDYINNIANIRAIDTENLSAFKNMLLNYKNSKSNLENANWMTHQTYIALGNLLTVCALLNIDACPMEGFNPDEYDKILNLQKDKLTSTLVIPVGYASKSDKYILQKKVRRSLNNFLIVK